MDPTVLRFIAISYDHWEQLQEHWSMSSTSLVVDRTSLTRTWRVALVVVDGHVQGALHARRLRRAGDFQHELQFREYRSFSPPPELALALSQLPPNTRRHVVQEGDQSIPPAASRALEAVIDDMSAGSRAMLDDLRARLESQEPTDLALSFARERFDAQALGMEMAGLSSRDLLSPTDQDSFAAFLSKPTRRRVSEAGVIRHDASVFSDWLPANVKALDVQEFVDPADPRRRVTVIYTDKEPLERLTGTDLIYYREHCPGFILVQYKRMRRDDLTRSRAVYYPDKQLGKEIARFDKLPASLPPTSVDEWRLGTDAFFVKLVDEDLSKPEENRLVHGYYLPESLVKLLLSAAEAGAGPVGWSSDQLRTYLSNGEFLTLAKQGYIGTTGATTAALRVLVQNALESGRAVLVTFDHTDPLIANRIRHS